SEVESLEAPLLCSVQEVSFRQPLSLLVAYAFPAGVFVLLSNHQLEAVTYMKPTFTITTTITTKKPEPSIKLMVGI
ncbi:hypothetical protein, partial [Priestia aryabhattai]|uniref:hypothetical protein n=1 Tax=Priestia aryabhattai TaxID=412384 RepID=UPI002E2329DB|nr:hypothetical protein [Priestia aryabhattai]